MIIENITTNYKFIKEYSKICLLEWGVKDSLVDFNTRLDDKVNRTLLNKDGKILSVLGLIDNDILVGFISLFKYDGEERLDLSPWYATMYVKREYRGKGYSKILNNAILKESKRLGFKKIYLKTELVNYYEKFGFKYLEDLSNKEKIYYIEL